MIEATVVGYDGARLVARVAPRPACDRCLEGRGCGMGLLGARGTAPETVTLTAPSRPPPVGSTVVLAGSPGVAAGALIGYGLPLAGLLAGAAAGPLVSLPGFVAGVVLARRLAHGRVGWRVVADGRTP